MSPLSKFCILLTTASMACGDSSTSEGGSGGTASTGGGGSGVGGDGVGGDGTGGDDGLPDLEEGWNEFTPEGTTCSRGAPYSFWVRPGTVNKVVLQFSGGGACWDDDSCAVADSLFSETVDGTRDAVEANMPKGLANPDQPDNPVAGWYHVLVPYCTGDIHWGDAVTTYGAGANQVTINHKGAVNVRAVLDWVYDNFAAPEQIFVTGCSAGSYGAALWSAHVREHYPNASVYAFGDSGAGIITDQFFTKSFESWNAEQALPAFIPELDPSQVDIGTLDIADLYSYIGNHFSDMRLAQYNTWMDQEQIFYFQVMTGGGTADQWNEQMVASMDEIESRASNFKGFIASGEEHCIIGKAELYTVDANGVRLIDWLGGMVEGESIDPVRCDGAECDEPTF